MLAILQKKHPYAGYAKALYYHLTGELLQSDLPIIFNIDSNPRSAGKKEISTSFFPNPFTNQLTIIYNEDKPGMFVVTDLDGKSIFQSAISHDMSISVNEWKQGMYIITIQSNNEVLVQEKIVLIK